ncbi:MAG: MarR family transcriptional regulator, partial [Armatimonadota bacterium]|nr:MarR family transcriptional regulator [Armatimonadota bacterium]
LYLSAFFERNRPEYYRRLLAVSQRGEWEAWLLFFLKGVAEQSLDAVARARRLQSLWQRYREALQSARASALLLRLVDRLFADPAVSVGQAAQELGVTPRAAQQNVDRLVDQGIVVEATGRQRNRVYVAAQILRVLEEDD